MWCIPPKQSGEFVCHMEDVLDVYHRPYDPGRPVVCPDETFKRLIGEVREPLPPAPGPVERYDSVYVRNGVASLFITFEPLAGWRRVELSGSRTAMASHVSAWEKRRNGPKAKADWQFTTADARVKLRKLSGSSGGTRRSTDRIGNGAESYI